MYGQQSSAIVDQSLDNLIQSFISNKLSNIKSMQHQNNTLMIYCDASLPKDNQLIGIGICMVGQQKVSFASEALEVESTKFDSRFGELQALLVTAKLLNKMLLENTYNIKKLREVIILSDCIGIPQLIKNLSNSKALYRKVVGQINELLEHLSETYPRIIFKVKYIGQNRNFYYEMADQLAKEAIKKKLLIEEIGVNVMNSVKENEEVLFGNYMSLGEKEKELIRKAMTYHQLIDSIQDMVREKGDNFHIPTLEKAILKFNTELGIINAETLNVRLKGNIIANQLGERLWDLLRSDAAKQGFIVPDDAMSDVR
ncbi:hypothetical protein [Paenibacillus sp. MDMC362]|uniref:hypothetical protein n=1 Tax=Paenibacillus sp. MDMC362 TaxID=2977365 RepID=UPI000DC4AE51|nr:hypothetical protein [Paenibacillus sp. MDMC362]RAR38906.1 hypothetical protein DP091_30665 [Paenibacillus sp. MDMC362]